MSNRRMFVVFAMCCCLVLGACGKKNEQGGTKTDPYLQKHSQQGVYHQVQRGETVNSIAREYGTTPKDLIQANGIANPDWLQVGFVMYIPGADEVRHTPKSLDPPQPIAKDKPPLNPSKRKGPISAEASFAWPVKGKILVRFGDAADGISKFRGIKIACRVGTRVQVAKSGKVTWTSKGMAGYGKVIAVQHSDGFTTLYGYCSEVLVAQGDWLKQGDVIALSGQSGLTRTASLYFQISTESKDLNPLTKLK